MPTPIRWQVPTPLSATERRVADKLHRIGKFYVFLREIRAELFDEAFEAELVAAYQPRGVAPLPPALLAAASTDCHSGVGLVSNRTGCKILLRSVRLPIRTTTSWYARRSVGTERRSNS